MSRIRHLPVALFTTLMGSAGLTLVWEKGAEVFGLPLIISEVLLALTLGLMILLGSSYAIKFLRFREEVCQEFYHPIKISFFPAFSIGLMLVATALHQHLPQLSLVLWSVGALLQLLLTLFLMNQWIHHSKTQINHTTPAWFIPIVGNIIAPIEAVALGFTELGWFFFSIGLIYWIVLKVLVFNRVLYHDPLPKNLLPTLFILIAPPAVGFIAYQRLSAGAFDAVAHVLYYTALFLVILLLTQVGRFARLPFFISWWAYS
ncbi:MAG: C4-dicarboxylate ABC transporter, partial [Oceanospirillaceae bacterium]|nr:C4-dicarboxylate ABC transporter [Oceanospirillaceae bacterium]